MNRKQHKELRALVPWTKGEVCPCGSGENYGKCCDTMDGWPTVKIPHFFPAPKAKETPVEDCYLKTFGGCGGDISREHYISEGILNELGTLDVGGLPWVPKGQTKRLSSKTMYAWVLCEDHNNALSPVDKLGIRAFRNVKKAYADIVKFLILSTVSHTLISGSALEFWGLKCLAGMYFGKIAANNQERLLGSHEINLDLLREILVTRKFPANCGLYVRTESKTYYNDFSVAPLSTPTHVIGIRVQWLTFEFEIIFDPVGTNFDAVRREAEFRPRVLALRCQQRKTFIIMSYLEPSQGNQIDVEIQPKFLGH